MSGFNDLGILIRLIRIYYRFFSGWRSCMSIAGIPFVLDLLVGTKAHKIEKAIEQWARWVVNGLPGWLPNNMGYGNPHEALKNVSSRNKGGAKNDFGGGNLEASIERALWRYQRLGVPDKAVKEVYAFRVEYLMDGTQDDKADDLYISVSTYKRRVKKVKQYVEKECFTDYIFEA